MWPFLSAFFTTLFSSFTHFAAWISASLIFVADTDYVAISYLFTHSSVDALRLFPFCDCYEWCCYEHHVQVVGWAYIFNYLGFIPRNGLPAHWLTLQRHLWGTARLFPNSCTVLSAHQLHMRILISPHSHQNVLLPICVILAILVGDKWHLISLGLSYFSRAVCSCLLLTIW